MQDEQDDWLDEHVSPGSPATPQSATQGPDQQIDFDLNCVRCGYNLRSTLASGRCPECGEPVETTLRPDLLHMSSPRWLGKLSKGANWLVSAIIANLLLIPIAMIIGFITIQQSIAQGSFPTGAFAFLTVLGLIVTVLYAIGIWLITTLEPDKIRQPITVSLTRWLIIPGMLLSMLGDAFTNSSNATAVTIGGFIDIISSIMSLVGFLAGLLYLKGLAGRIPEPKLASQTQAVFWGWLITMSGFILLSIAATFIALSGASASSLASILPILGLLMIPLGLAILVFLIWWIVLMFRYRTRFSQAYEMATGRSDTEFF